MLPPIADGANRSAVTGVFTFYGWIAETRAAVPELLATALRAALTARKIAVLEPASDRSDVPALTVRIERWEAENSDFPQFVNVTLNAELAAPDGRVLWTAPPALGPVATRGATSLDAAYRRAAEAVATRLVEGCCAARTP